MTTSPAATFEGALRPLTDSALAAADGVLARVWLTGPADACATCAMAPECPDRRRCLHLVASAGLTSRLDGPFRRFPLGARQVGRVPVTGTPFAAGDELPALGLADPAWLAAHAVRGFAAVPLTYGGRVIGVLAVFGRVAMDGARIGALEQVATLGALAIGHTLAFREMANQRNRVVARAARDRAGPAAGVASVPGRPDPTAPDLAPAFAADAVLRPLADTERDVIARVLAHTRGRVSGPNGAARILGMKPTTLFSRMKKLGVARKPGHAV